jgi:hypothetical protein
LKNGDMPVLFKRSDLIEFFEKIDSFFPTENISRLNFDLNIGNLNYEAEFKEYLKFSKKLSDKSIKNYTNALKGRISEGLKKHFIHSLESIYFIHNVSILEKLNVKLFEKEEYKKLKITGKNMYSCAFDNYISFINNLSIDEVIDELKLSCTKENFNEKLIENKAKLYKLYVNYKIKSSNIDQSINLDNRYKRLYSNSFSC